MIGIDDWMLATFLEAAPEMFAAEAGTAALGADAASAAAAAALGADAASAALGSGLGSAAGLDIPALFEAYPELATNPNLLADLTQERAINSGITSVANFNPSTSMYGSNSMQLAGASPGIPPASGGPLLNEYGEAYRLTDAASATGPLQLPPGAPAEAGYTVAEETPSALQKGWSAFSDFAKKYPYPTAAGAYVAGNALGLFNPNQQSFNAQPYNGPLNKFRLSPNFQGRQANPEDFQYTPRRYAEGGIAGYKAGGSAASAMEYYTDMIGGERERQIASVNKPHTGDRDVGIVRDSDPDTMYLDPLSAAQVRMAKINKRANMQMPGMKRPTPMGQINLQPSGIKASSSSPDVESAAEGGIMEVVDTPMADRTPSNGKYLLDPDTYKYIWVPNSVITPFIQDIGDVQDRGGIRSSERTYAPVEDKTGTPVLTDLEASRATSEYGPAPKGEVFQNAYEIGMTHNSFPAERMGGTVPDDSKERLSVVSKPDIVSDPISRGLPVGTALAPMATDTIGRVVDMGDQGGRLQSGGFGQTGLYGDASAGMSAFGDAAVGAGGGFGGNIGTGEFDGNPESASNLGYAHGGITSYAQGGIGALRGYSLGGYAAGGNPRLLKGPGDGMSDNIPATIANKQPARLADGEFVVPADVVSHLGNGSTDAGGKKLHGMMTRVRKARTGNPKQGKRINPNRFMPK